jgi:hypothetical protein
LRWIAGASYSGYATLMELIREPQLYRCGIDWAGVTDIKLMYTGHWRRADDLSGAYKRYGMPKLIACAAGESTIAFVCRRFSGAVVVSQSIRTGPYARSRSWR